MDSFSEEMVCVVLHLLSPKQVQERVSRKHTHGHKLGTQAGINFLSFIKHKSKQTMPNQWAGLIDKRLQEDTSEQKLKQNKQEEKREKQSFTVKIRHTCVLLRTNTHVYFARPYLMRWEMGMILGVHWGPHKFSNRIQCSNSMYYIHHDKKITNSHSIFYVM